MSFRFNKRISLGKGLGLNISKSGIAPSYRSKRGSVSSKGYSVRSRIPGLTYRKTFSKSNNSGCLVVFLFHMVLGFAISCSSIIFQP